MDATPDDVGHNWRRGFLALTMFSALALCVVEVGPAAVAGQGDPRDATTTVEVTEPPTTEVPLRRVLRVAGDGDLRTELLVEARDGLLPLVEDAGDAAGAALGAELAELLLATTTTTSSTTTTSTTTTALPTPAPAPASEPAPTSAGADTWDRLAACEASGNWAMNSGNGYYGGLQFSLATWQHYGGAQFAPYPHEATREQQITVGERLVAAHGGSYGAWPSCQAALGLP